MFEPNTKIKFSWLLALLLLSLVSPSFAVPNPADEVVVLYNTREPESKGVAEHYAEKRGVPAKQVLGIDISNSESINRHDFQEHLQKPLTKQLVKLGLFHFETVKVAASNGVPEHTIQKLTESKIRYLAICYGIPLIIVNDETLHEPGEDKMLPQLRRNDAAVDSELSCLPRLGEDFLLSGPAQNFFQGCTNAAQLNPTNGILMVTRLDGPTPAIARSLVDRSMQAETNGLWGRAYFDLRGITNGPYQLGETFINGAASVAQSAGYDVTTDFLGSVFPSSYPVSHVALYAGWYEENITGAFARSTVEFVPGAFAYHLHSFSGATLRSTKRQWCGPLLQRGVTATMGTVNEPFLPFTPNIAIFFHRFIALGFTYGEAAYAAQTCLSWQTTVVGDPLYRPFVPNLSQRHADMEKTNSKYLDWSYAHLANVLLLHKTPPADIIRDLEGVAIAKQSPVIQEKLAELYALLDKKKEVIDALKLALKLKPSPQQEVRLAINAGHLLLSDNRQEECFDIYAKLVIDVTDYSDKLTIYRTLAELAHKLGKQQEAEGYERIVTALTPPEPAKK